LYLTFSHLGKYYYHFFNTREYYRCYNGISTYNLIKFNLRGCQRTICFLYLAHVQHRQNAFTQYHFFMFLSNLRVKLNITKKIKNIIFERITYLYYILYANFFCKFKCRSLNYFETIFRQIDTYVCHFLKNIIPYLFCEW